MTRAVSSGGLRLAVFEDGAEANAAGPSTPVLLFVHGYPDTHEVWNELCAELGSRFRLARYDVRGAGASQAPEKTADYRLDLLADDLFAVLDAVSPDQPVHLVAHDWGSIQGWHAVTDARASGRIASFTTISGPCLDHTAFWFRERRRHPTPRNLAQLLTQATKSWYIYAFHLPFAATLIWRWWLAKNWGRMLSRTEGVPLHAGHPQPTLVDDAIRGIKLYRANMLPRMRRPELRYALLPVQMISPAKDRFVSPLLAEGLEKWAPDLRRHTVSCGHWAVLSRSAPCTAELISTFVDEVQDARRKAD